jgi:hypothetical protein
MKPVAGYEVILPVYLDSRRNLILSTVEAECSRYQWRNPLWCVMIARVLLILDEGLWSFLVSQFTLLASTKKGSV